MKFDGSNLVTYICQSQRDNLLYWCREISYSSYIEISCLAKAKGSHHSFSSNVEPFLGGGGLQSKICGYLYSKCSWLNKGEAKPHWRCYYYHYMCTWYFCCCYILDKIISVIEVLPLLKTLSKNQDEIT